MLEENKNIKDTFSMPAPYEAEGFRLGSVSVSYTKTNKLITALYMVTDIMDREEPLRNKLRTLGVNILSDIHSAPKSAFDIKDRKVLSLLSEVLSLLDIASGVGMISGMNCSILRKEFLELKKSIEESTKQDSPNWLEEFLKDSPLDESPDLNLEGEENAKSAPLRSSIKVEGHLPRGGSNPIGQSRPASSRLGVQKGSTLLKALKGFEGAKMSNSFDDLKKQRRDLILKIIKDNPEGMSIKDINLALRNRGESWGEKTLQRELVSMTHDAVLNKTGEKRWSRYSLKK